MPSLTQHIDKAMNPLTLVVVAITSTHAQKHVDIRSLLMEMGNLNSVSELANPPFKQIQASSYDRKQVDPKDLSTWFANEDYGQFIRTEDHQGRKEWVVMDQAGPGAITRIWTPLLAEKDKMIVRFYFDGNDKPTIEEPFNDLMRGRRPIKPPFAYIAWPDAGVADGVGADCYFPIPFAKGCKVTFSEVPFYYAFSSRTYASDTPVTSFTWDDFDRQKPLAAKVAASLGKWKPESSPAPTAQGELQSGKSVLFNLPEGSHSVTEIQLRVPANVSPQALRSTVISIRADGEQTVWCPVGEFFGCGVTLKPLWDRFRRVEADGTMTARWPMPYQKHARVEVLNLGSESLPVRLQVHTTPYKWTTKSLHFHSTWRFQDPIPTQPRSDWNYVEASGQGHYVGDTLTVMNPTAAWYGEGDERVYVDGEKFPSSLGTGTEDYYGYAWGMDKHWSSAYMSMPLRGRKGRENWTGFTTTSRVRGLDLVPFTSKLKFDMEIWHWADCSVAYSAASFWYGKPGVSSNITPDAEAASRELRTASTGIKGAIECETMTVDEKSADIEIGTQNAGLTSGTWSGGEQLFVQAKRVGDYVVLGFDVPKGGTYNLKLYGTRSYDYGVIQPSIDKQKLETIDLWSEKAVATGALDLGRFELTEGHHQFRVEVVNTNPNSRGSKVYFGLDCLVLEPGK